jgi:hypothetical protein
MGSAMTFNIYHVNYTTPALIRFSGKNEETGDIIQLSLTRDEDIVTLFFEEGGVSTLYHKIKPIREYMAELLMRDSFGPNRIQITDPFGIQHKSFWEIEQ